VARGRRFGRMIRGHCHVTRRPGPRPRVTSRAGAPAAPSTGPVPERRRLRPRAKAPAAPAPGRGAGGCVLDELHEPRHAEAGVLLHFHSYAGLWKMPARRRFDLHRGVRLVGGRIIAGIYPRIGIRELLCGTLQKILLDKFVCCRQEGPDKLVTCESSSYPEGNFGGNQLLDG
jgi:hypothetical protein